MKDIEVYSPPDKQSIYSGLKKLDSHNPSEESMLHVYREFLRMTRWDILIEDLELEKQFTFDYSKLRVV